MRDVIQIILFYCYVGLSAGNWDIFKKERFIPGIQRSVMPFEKCTRRFAPGKCQDLTVSVWTYMPLEQNCTERFGCQYFSRGNRFVSYQSCMSICMPLIKMYNALLTNSQVDEKTIFEEDPSDSFVEAVPESPQFQHVLGTHTIQQKRLPNYDKYLKDSFKWTDKNNYVVDKIFGQVFQDIDQQGFPSFYKNIGR